MVLISLLAVPFHQNLLLQQQGTSLRWHCKQEAEGGRSSACSSPPWKCPGRGRSEKSSPVAIRKFKRGSKIVANVAPWVWLMRGTLHKTEGQWVRRLSGQCPHRDWTLTEMECSHLAHVSCSSPLAYHLLQWRQPRSPASPALRKKNSGVTELSNRVWVISRQHRAHVFTLPAAFWSAGVFYTWGSVPLFTLSSSIPLGELK